MCSTRVSSKGGRSAWTLGTQNQATTSRQLCTGCDGAVPGWEQLCFALMDTTGTAALDRPGSATPWWTQTNTAGTHPLAVLLPQCTNPVLQTPISLGSGDPQWTKRGTAGPHSPAVLPPCGHHRYCAPLAMLPPITIKKRAAYLKGRRKLAQRTVFFSSSCAETGRS